jgi:hypothetical protein
MKERIYLNTRVNPMKKLLLTIVMSAVGISAYASPSPLSEKFVAFKKPDYAQQIISNHHTVQNVVIKECKGTEWGILNDKLDDQATSVLGGLTLKSGTHMVW